MKSGPLRQQFANVPRRVWDPKGRFPGITHEYGRYKATVRVGERIVALGRWATPQKAAVAIDRAALHFGLDQSRNSDGRRTPDTRMCIDIKLPRVDGSSHVRVSVPSLQVAHPR